MPSFVFGIKLEMQELEKKAQSHPLLLIRWLGEPKHMRNHPVAPQEPITRKDRVTSCHPGVQIRIFFFFLKILAPNLIQSLGVKSTGFYLVGISAC